VLILISSRKGQSVGQQNKTKQKKEKQMSETATTAPVIPADPLVLDSGPNVINRNNVDQPYKMFKFL